MVLLAIAGILVTVMVVMAMVLVVPGGHTASTDGGAFGQEPADHGTAGREPLYPDR